MPDEKHPSSSQADLLGDFCADLQRLRRKNSNLPETPREREISLQSQLALALADERSIRFRLEESFSALAESITLKLGSEHFVEFDPIQGRVFKTTLPGTFGLIPGVISLRDSFGKTRRSVEAIDATPIEYLQRWLANNEVFSDDVQLEAILEWPDGRISFTISQPAYHGEPARSSEIREHFEQAGWKRLSNFDGHQFFFNFAFQVLAMDAEPRNCHLTKDGLQPFDVILTQPNSELEELLRIYS